MHGSNLEYASTGIFLQQMSTTVGSGHNRVGQRDRVHIIAIGCRYAAGSAVG